MNKKEQIQRAFNLCEQLAKIEDLLWDRYYKEFLELILEKEDKRELNNDTEDFVF